MDMRGVARRVRTGLGDCALLARDYMGILVAMLPSYRGKPGRHSAGSPAFRKISDPRDTTSPWDSGWRFFVGCAATGILLGYFIGAALVGIGIAGGLK